MDDLSSLDFGAVAEEGFDVLLTMPARTREEELDPDFIGRGLCGPDEEPMFVKVVGKDSSTFKAQRLKISRKLAKLDKKKLTDYSVGDAAIEDSIQALAACTKGGRIYINGAWVELNRENAAEYYRKYEWLRLQVDAATLDRGKLDLDSKKN